MKMNCIIQTCGFGMFSSAVVDSEGIVNACLKKERESVKEKENQLSYTFVLFAFDLSQCVSSDKSGF